MLFLPIVLRAQSPVRTISGNITNDYTFYKDTTYLLSGFVYVKNNATLRIQPGTLIKGKKAERSTLIITMGSKIIADGTRKNPIVFTSASEAGQRAPGDWGGLVILGKGLINRPSDCNTCPGASLAASLPGVQAAIEGDIDNAVGDGLFGGTDNEDNSGILRYVRVEFAGVVISPGNEINAITLGAVGRGTVMEYIQVSQSNDDAFEWFGGAVNAKYLIAQGSVDDDFDADMGYIGNIQFAISQRDSFLFDTGTNPTTNSIETDSDAGSGDLRPITAPVFSNFTMIGPCASGTIEDVGSFQNGARIRKNSRTSLFNSVFLGQLTALFLDGQGSSNAFLEDSLKLKNNYIAGSSLSHFRSNQDELTASMNSKFFANGNDTLKVQDGLLMNPFSYENPDFRPESSSPLLSGASFTENETSTSFFTPVSFRGAMGSEDWTACWTEFQPNNPAYLSFNQNGPKVDFEAEPTDDPMIMRFVNKCENAVSFFWDMGDQTYSTAESPEHRFESPGVYRVTLVAEGTCGYDTLTREIQVAPNGLDSNEDSQRLVQVRPNPSKSEAWIELRMKRSGQIEMQILDLSGRVISSKRAMSLSAGQHQVQVHSGNLPAGFYLLKLYNESGIQEQRFVIW